MKNSKRRNHKNVKNNKNIKTKKWDIIWDKIVKNKEKIYMRTIEILGIGLAIYGLFITLLVRQDTAELTKLSEKPMYYKIKIYPNAQTRGYEKDKYVNWDLNLIVDDFEINKEKFLDVNYNSVFTHVTYYMVYDYNLQDKPTYYYKFDALDDKTQAQMRLEDEYYVCVSNMNYSLTPNKKYCYILIHTETLSEENLDLIFFKYNGEELELIEVDDEVQVDITDVREEHLISREYYTAVWAENDQEAEDIDFMFNVYEDLRGKIKEQL